MPGIEAPRGAKTTSIVVTPGSRRKSVIAFVVLGILTFLFFKAAASETAERIGAFLSLSWDPGKLVFALMLLGVLCGFIALVCLPFAVRGSVEAPCPACGGRITTVLWRKDNTPVRCPCCHEFVEGTNGRVWVVPDDRVSEQGIFKSDMPDGAKLPETCCRCGQPATRSDQYQWRKGFTYEGGGGPKPVVAMIAVPYCAAHRDAITVREHSQYGTRTIVFQTPGPLREFCRLNDTMAGSGS
jgi:hypothetical protein